MREQFIAYLQFRYNLSPREALAELQGGRFEAAAGRDPRDICKDIGVPLKFLPLFGGKAPAPQAQPQSKRKPRQSSLAALI